MTKPPELKACPFCSTSLAWSDLYSEYHHPRAKCILSGRTFKKGVIGQWNTRTPDPAVQALVEALRWQAEQPEAHPFMANHARSALAAFDNAKENK